MERNTVSGIMLTLLVTSMLIMAFDIPLVKAGGTIYIRADGSVDPPTTPIQRDGDIYTFTDSINDSIVVERNNIIVDGNGYNLQGPGSSETVWAGFYLIGRINVTIRNTNIVAFYYGIFMSEGTDNVISENNITNNGVHGILLHGLSNTMVSENNIGSNQFGIFLDGSSNVTLRNNRIYGNRYNFGVGGVWIELSIFIHDIDSSNTVNGKPIYYWVNRQNERVPADAGFVALVSSTNITVTGINLNNNFQGLLLAYTKNSLISGNNIINNWDGIQLYESSNNDIYGNNIIAHTVEGFFLWYSPNNKIYHNNFVNNTIQVYVQGGYAIVWDDSYPSGGNYWSDYAGVDLYSGPNQDIPGSDGVGDTPYVIDVGNQDRYPLMKPWGLPPGMSADLARRAAFPEHHHFVLSKDGDSSIDDRHGTPGNQTLYAIVKNTGNITVTAGTYKVVWK